MGYSCSAKASYVLDAFKALIHPNNGNTFTVGGVSAFWEIGRENDDGAITGTVWKMLPDGHCTKSGSFKIDSDGKIVRFPFIPTKLKKQVEETGIKKYTEIYG